tara:strand:+ start:2129 stop:3055 length:927 start_codon:yes stop_codon:yes gene_type:complete
MAMVTKQEPKAPNYTGVTVTGMEWIPLSKIKRNKNDGRASDFKLEKVSRMETAIIAGKWEPLNYEPPMVVDNGDGTFTLKTGNHRYMAHKGVGEDTMWCAIVVFASPRVEVIVKNLENAEEEDFYVKEYRSADDIIKSASDLLALDEDDDLEINEKRIKAVLKELNCEKHDEYNEILKALKEDHGIRPSVANVTEDQLNAYIASKGSNSVPVSQMFRSSSSSVRDERLFKDILDAKVEHGAGMDVTAYTHYTQLTAKKVIEGRKNRPVIFEQIKEKWKRRMEVLNSPEWTDPKFDNLPQIDGVEVNVD